MALDANGNTVDMTTGTTALVAAAIDQGASAVTSIGFNFTLMGTTYTQFSASSNGTMALGSTAIGTAVYTASGGTTTTPLLTAWGADAITTTNGVRSKVVGTAPNRCLVVEFNIGLYWLGSAPASQYQVRLYESTGVIEYVYGAMAMGTSTTTGAIGFATGSAVNSLASVTCATNTVSTSTWAANATTASSPVTNLNSASNGSRRVYTFTPPGPAVSPTSLNITNIGAGGMTLNWTPGSGSYRIYRSLNNTAFSLVGSTAVGASSYVATGLNPNTTYYWNVEAFSESSGAVTPVLNGNATTSAPTLSGTKTVCPSGCDYANLTTATADLAAQGLAGSVVLELAPTYVSTTETFPITFSNFPGLSSSNTVSVTVNSAASGLSIANTATTGTAQTIDLNGTYYVTIDGRPGSTGTASQLSISSANLGTQTIRYINGTNNTTLNYVSVTGVNNGTTTATYGLIAFLGTTGTTSTSGNRYNTISNCTIGAGATSPLKGIYSAGQSSTILNDYNSVLNCNFVDIFNVTAASTQNSVSIDISGTNNSDWTVTGNSFYLTTARAHTAGAIVQTAVYTGGGNGYNISNNYFGGSGPQCSGTWTINGTAASYRFNALNMSGGTLRTSSIQGNTVSNINIVSTTAVASAGNPLLGGIIIMGSGNVNVGDITPNLIGSSSAVDNLVAANSTAITTNGNGVVGIFCSSTGIVNIKNNIIGGLTYTSGTATIATNVVGIMNSGGTGKKVISGNTVGGNFSNSFRAGTSGFSTTGANTVIGINNTGAGVVVVSGNTLSNYVAYGTTGVTVVRGVLTSSGTDTIANNNISNLSTNGAGSAMGIASSATTAGIDITRNSINNLTVVNSGASARGIQISSGLATPRVAYNFIQGISAPSSNGNAMIMGIDIGHTVAQNIYNNTIVLGTSTTPLTGVTNFGVIGISYNTGTTDIRNNLVYINATAIGTGVNIALRRVAGTNGTAPTNLANTSNSNIYYVPSADYNYFYAEGATANRVTIVNAYHNCASCTNTGVTTAPVVDANINSSCAKYKAFMGASSSRESGSFYENVTFAGGSTIPNNLVPAPTGGTFVLNGGSVVSGLTTDYFGNAVSGTTPDIGASEFTSGTTQDATAPSITYTAIAATACASNPTLTATITDASGVDFASNPPRVYYRYSTDAVTGLASANNNTVGGWKFVTASSQVGNNFNFTLDYSLLNTTVAAATVIQYFVVAQDLAATPNVKLSTVGLASGFCATSVALGSSAFPIVASPTVNSLTISAVPTITLSTIKTENCTGGVALTLSGSDGIASYDFQYSTFSNGTWTSYATQPTKVSATSYTLTGLNATTNNNDIVRLVATCPGAGAPLFTSSRDTIKNLGDCQFAVTRSTGNTYSSIMSTGNTYSALTSADDAKTNNISLLGTTFKYRGAVVKGFYATTNGWMTFDTTQTSNTYTNNLTTLKWVIAPFWDDLVLKGNSLTNQNICMKYQVIGTLGSGTADIVIEWAEMERYAFPAPNLNFQVVLHELDNSIDINYGNMQLFDGSSSTGVFTYSVGVNGTTSATASLDQRMLQQNTNTNYFTSDQQQNLSISPDCYSRLRFVSSSSYSGTAPTIGAPANNEPGTATTLTVNASPCTLFCGNIYTSLNATATPGVTACSATTSGVADDDVYFSFTTTVAPQYQITVTPSLTYDAVVQVLNSSMTPVACLNAGGQGIQESLAALALSSGTYYVRVYDAATGASGSGEFAICVSEVIPPPSNDNVSGATTLTVGTSCVPTNSPLPNILAATASPQTVCTGTADDDVWYKFTATSSGMNVRVNGVSTYNPVMQIFSDSGITQVACQNSTGNGAQETYSATNFNIGQVYYVRVYHAGNGAANGNFNICVFANVPTCTTKISPSSGASLISGANLSWNAATYAAGYDVYLDVVNPPLNVVSSNQTGTTYATSGLIGSTV
ncbi:MAG: fibronectin type III domain-containing protein, partial [Bacteroidetes bacterium]|nr:fibronectin type III domain-containing protein [Bacteroidota bacterium]